MKLKSVLQRTAAVLMSLFLCVCCLPRAYALAPIENRSCSLTVDFTRPGVTFRVYRAGDLSDKGRFTLTGDFASYSVGDLSNLSGGQWGALAETLAGYVARDHLPYLKQGETNSSGQLRFDGLARGLYLVVGERTGFSGTGADGLETTTYVTPKAFLVSLPTWQEGDTWTYDVTAKPKPGEEDGTVSSVMRRVLKVWNDRSEERRGGKEC